MTHESAIYSRKKYLINARPVYQMMEGGDSLYFNNGVWQVINQFQQINFSNLLFVKSHNSIDPLSIHDISDRILNTTIQNYTKEYKVQ